MAAKWRRRSDPAMPGPTPGPVTRNKRGDHPSPAYGSPAAELVRGANGKRVRGEGVPKGPSVRARAIPSKPKQTRAHAC